MALVLKQNGVTVTVQTRDHRPPHVQVDSPDNLESCREAWRKYHGTL
ncbi:MAG: hypothetical protein WA885_08760 [Phormidesmis sp.]